VNRLVIIVVALLLLGASTTEARQRRQLPALEWGLKAGLEGIYNDNILRLSESDINAFHRFDPAFRTPVETTDDAETELTLSPSIDWRAPATTMVALQYRFKAVGRARNDYTNYQTHGVSLNVRPRVRGYKWSVRAGVFTIPSFYLRVYRDRDLGTYDDARFANWEYTGNVSYRPAEPLWLSVIAGVGTYYYNARFTEYDSEYREVGGEAEYTTRWDPRLTLRYVRRISDNLGSTQPGGTSFGTGGPLEDTEYGDGDFNEDDFRLSVKTPVKGLPLKLLTASLDSRLRRRVYTTDRSLEADPFHRGRLDNRWEITPALSWSATSVFELNAHFTYEQRSVESDYSPVALVKDFVRREVGIGVTYRIN